jgi:predicted nuclease of predicted toxin-antitoxin system
MRVLCDVHIPYRLVNRLRELGVDATHVNRVLDGSTSKDAAIAEFVDTHEMLLVTKDSDFRDSHLVSGTPAQVLRLTLGNLTNSELISLIEAHWTVIAQLCVSESCYMELSRDGLIHLPETR